jgi:predicted permease
VRYTEEDTQRFFDQLLERSRSVPGVKSVTISSTVPMSQEDRGVATIVPEGFQLPPGKEGVTLTSNKVDESYFETMGISIVGGRAFHLEDNSTAPRIAVVNEQLGAHYWPGQNPIGKRFRMNNSRGPWVEIVGVARNAKYQFFMEPPTEHLYLARRQNPVPRLILIAESVGDPASLVAPLRDVVHGLDANQPIYNVRTMEEFFQMNTITIFNVVIGTVAALGMMGMGLAIVGLYGLASYAASRRTREIGIRMAIGAGRADVMRMVLRQGMILALVGLAVGLVASVGALRLFQAVWEGKRASDPVALLLVGPAVLAVTLLAAYVPARRAARLDPVKALRQE